MELKIVFVYVGLITLVSASQIIDALGYKFRCNKNKNSWPNSTAISGILFYLARLGFMLYVTLLAILHEALSIKIETLNIVTLIGLCFAVIYLLLAKRNNLLAKATLFCIGTLRIFKNEPAEMEINYDKTKDLILDKKLLAYSFLVNFFVLFCNLLPVNLVVIFPKMGMSLVYLSQMLSVVAGLSWYILQEPKIVDSLTASKFDDCYRSLVLGKIASIALIIVLLVGLLLYAC
jgi:hypothetical protein